jgi:hypothetical protein
MKWIIFVQICIIGILLVTCYALLVTAHEADERAERMYRKWKESKDGRFDKTE